MIAFSPALFPLFCSYYRFHDRPATGPCLWQVRGAASEALGQVVAALLARGGADAFAAAADWQRRALAVTAGECQESPFLSSLSCFAVSTASPSLPASGLPLHFAFFFIFLPSNFSFM